MSNLSLDEAAWCLSAVAIAAPGQLHCQVDDSEQLCGEAVQVDLLAQPTAEGLHGSGRVVAGSVEAPVDQALDAMPQGLEQRGHGHRRGGYGQLRSALGRIEQVASDEHPGGVHPGQQGGGQSVDRVRLISRSMSNSRYRRIAMPMATGMIPTPLRELELGRARGSRPTAEDPGQLPSAGVLGYLSYCARSVPGTPPAASGAAAAAGRCPGCVATAAGMGPASFAAAARRRRTAGWR
jgi:hypothetical protein